jgi:tight adherence protein C
MPLLMTLLAFSVVTAIVLAGWYAATAESPIVQRLRMLGTDPVEQPRETAVRRGPRLLARVLTAIGQYGLGNDETSLHHSLTVAGFRSRNATMLFLGVRTLLSFGPGLLVLVGRISGGKPLGASLVLAIIAWAYGHTLVNYWLKRRTRRRIHQITIALPDCLDLMIVCLEAGLGLNATIARLGEERSLMDDALGDEFGQVAVELREGRSRDESLRALGERNGVEDLRSLVALIIQSDRLGASMARTLRAHADVLRAKRRQRAEEAARKLPVKMLFPLAVLILPPLFVATAGPAILKFRQVMHLVTDQRPQ